MDVASLKKLPLFEGLSDKDLKQISQWTDEVDLPAGSKLVAEGKFAYEFMILESGTVEVDKEGSVVAELGPGNFFGEIALMGASDRRTADVIAKTPVKLVVMSAREFRSMTSSMPSVNEKIQQAIKERL